MTNAELRQWRRASEIAYVAMGRLERGPGRASPAYRWKADEDPLAWWVLTELIMDFAKRGAA